MSIDRIELESLIDSLGGVTPAVGDSLNPLEDSAIAEIEARFDRQIPVSVKCFLQKYGAVIFLEDVYFVPDQPFPTSYSPSGRGIVSGLLGQSDPNYPNAKSISILHVLSILKHELALDFLPIGDTTLGNLILISMRTDDYGEVHLWHHDAPVGNDLYHLNGSFDGWLRSLFVCQGEV